MSHEERIDTIRRFGYTRREACFLELVALHSGYFLRRQYSAFLGRKRGGTAAALIRKALQKGHVRVEPSCDRTSLYHLRRRAFYERIGQPENRHRRRRGTVGIASKVMALDAILEMRDVAWLGTAAEKRAFFERDLSIPSLFLPSRKAGGGQKSFRYFVERTPIGVERTGQSAPPVVVFIYADPGTNTLGFETFLRRHQLLFACLPRLRVVHAGPSPYRLEAARETFDAFNQDLTSRRPAIIEAKVDRFGQFFDLMLRLPRDAQGTILEGALAKRNRLGAEIDPEDLVRLTRLSAQPGRPDMRRFIRPKAASGPHEASFMPLHLRHGYRLFGCLA